MDILEPSLEREVTTEPGYDKSGTGTLKRIADSSSVLSCSYVGYMCEGIVEMKGEDQLVSVYLAYSCSPKLDSNMISS